MNEIPTDWKVTLGWTFNFLAAAYPNQFKLERPQDSLESWYVILSGCTPEEVRKAVVVWCRTNPRWPPSAPQLNAAIPKNCRCGNCHRCIQRFMEKRQAIKAIERGEKPKAGALDWSAALPPRDSAPMLTEGGE